MLCSKLGHVMYSESKFVNTIISYIIVTFLAQARVILIVFVSLKIKPLNKNYFQIM